MHLMDCIAQAAPGLRIDDYLTGRHILMPGAGMFRDEIAKVPVRYILDDAVTATCAEMVASRQDFLADSLDIVRAPFQEFWIEWNESVRADMFSDHSTSGSATLGGRAGMLVKMDESGRAGTLRVFWSEDGQSADVNPAILNFDLDGHSHPLGDPEMRVRAQNTDLQAVFDRVTIDLDPDWKAYYGQRAHSQAHLRDTLSEVIGPATFDFPFLLSFALVLMAQAHTVRASDLSALNRARARKGRRELLEHMTVTQEVLGESVRQNAGVSGLQRTIPRLHLVRGHLVRRGDKVFWRTSHFRGRVSDVPLRRTVSLVMGNAA